MYPLVIQDLLGTFEKQRWLSSTQLHSEKNFIVMDFCYALQC